ncbi:MAG: FecR domain-containing protein, partial [Phycisphaerales bacterium]
MENRRRQIDRYVDGSLDASEIKELFVWLAKSPQNAEVFASQCLMDQHLTELLNGGFVEPLEVTGTKESAAAMPHALIPSSPSTQRRFRMTAIRRLTSAIAAVIVIMLSATVFLHFVNNERKTATVTGLSGALQWIGDRGKVSYDLSMGAELSGGTIESKSPDSWFEFEYHDGSTVTITGISTLTFSDHGQKNLYLKEGNVFVNAKPQSASKPMLIYTQTAIL